MSVESQCGFGAKCFLEVKNGISGNNRIRQVVPVAYDSIAELIFCNITPKLRGLKFKTVTSGGDSRGRGFHMYLFICVYIKGNIHRYTPITLYPTLPFYNIIIIFDTVVTQKRNIEHEKQ